MHEVSCSTYHWKSGLNTAREQLSLCRRPSIRHKMNGIRSPRKMMLRIGLKAGRRGSRCAIAAVYRACVFAGSHDCPRKGLVCGCTLSAEVYKSNLRASLLLSDPTAMLSAASVLTSGLTSQNSAHCTACIQWNAREERQ